MPRTATTITWTDEQDRYLEMHRSTLKTSTIAKYLGTTKLQVERRSTYLGITKFSNGYTVEALSEGFGCRANKVCRWIELGWLKAKRRNTERQDRDAWYVSDAAILEFLRAHYNEINLSYVNQDWFFDLVFGGIHGLGPLDKDAE